MAPITGLAGYSASGRLPFGAGAPDVVAFRVMSGDPDTADVWTMGCGAVECRLVGWSGGCDLVAERAA